MGLPNSGRVRFTPCFISRADWTRTSDLLTPSQTRYQTAPRPETLVLYVLIAIMKGVKNSTDTVR